MLQVTELTKTFGEMRALDSLSFEVEKGQVYGLLGPNGAGKSTAFSIICNLLDPDDGDVKIGGVARGVANKQTLGVVSQQIALYKNLTCGENLRFFAAIYGLRGERQKRRVDQCLDAVQLLDRRRSVVRTLSGGMQRRLHVAVALLHEPPLIILDEPSAGLDVESRQEMWFLIRRMQAEGKAVLLTTHILEEAEILCSNVGILQAGRKIAEGSPEELKRRVVAKQIVDIQTKDEEKGIQLAEKSGLAVRRQEWGFSIWLEQSLDFKQILDLFPGVEVDSISRRPVRLEDAYLEIVRNCKPRSSEAAGVQLHASSQKGKES